MASLADFQRLIKGHRRPHPFFCPAIYEHKARLINRPVAEICQDPNALIQACIAEYDHYQPDTLTVGVDVYNIEAQALGCQVTMPADPRAVPSITQRLGDDLDHVIDTLPALTQPAGRMPLFIKAASRVQQHLGQQTLVRGAVTAPYSIAAELIGIEPLAMALLTEPDRVTELLNHTRQTAKLYAQAFLDVGVQICLFDSQAVPPLVSPNTYKELVLPQIQQLTRDLRAAGAVLIEYVTGGNTTPVAPHLAAAGADILLCDYPADLAVFQRQMSPHQLIRRNLNPMLFEQQDTAAAFNPDLTAALNAADQDHRVIIGTGVLSCDVPPSAVQQLARQIRQFQ